ncbi:hypothetical protein [Deinococcus aquaticus]|uniref:hypothetical protein n=2 Tax=Deinococcus aquaticus TaxID=328692 RepID=UPI0031EB6BE5
MSDANILMDLGYVGGLGLLSQLGRAEVLSTVLLECEHAKQPNLVADIATAGIVTVDTTSALITAADAYATVDEMLSLQDRQCLLYARDQARLLLTGDRFLRSAADREQVRYHGSVWLVEEAWRQQLVAQAELCRWLTEWPLRSRRLPTTELNRLRALLGC